MKCKKADSKLCYYFEIVSFLPKSSERVGTTADFKRFTYAMKSAIVRDPLRGFGRETYYFTKITQFSYRLSYIS